MSHQVAVPPLQLAMQSVDVNRDAKPWICGGINTKTDGPGLAPLTSQSGQRSLDILHHTLENVW